MKHISQQRRKYRKSKICKNSAFSESTKASHQRSANYMPEDNFLNSILNALSGISVFVIDEFYLIRYCNEAFRNFLYQQKYYCEAVGTHLDVHFPLIDSEMLTQIEKAFASNSKIAFEQSSILASGKHYVNISITPISQEECDERLLAIIIEDITSQQLTHERADNLASILDHASDFASMKDLNERIVAANKAMSTAMKHSNSDEMYNHTKYPEKLKPTQENIKALKPGQCIEEEKIFLHSDGRKKHVQVNHFPIFDKNGKVCGTADIARDVSNLKNEHEKLQKNEYKYRMMIENQGDGVCILNDKNEFQFVNKACGNIFDCDSEDLIGKSIHEFLNKANKAKLKREIGLIEYNHTHSFELKIKLKKGKYKRILVMAASFTDDDPGNLLIFKDVTDQRNAEQELRQSEKKLKQLNATKDKFFSIIAHDLKNPFGSIMGFSNLILKKTDEQHFEKVADYARIIRKASADGFQLLENLLEWSRAQNGTLKHTPSNVLLNELIAHNIEICAGMAENKSISLKSHGNTNYHVFIDEDMINTVIRNLITNAIKFTPENKNITISAQQKDEAFVAVSIADEGIGIDTSDMKKLFKIEHSHSTRGTQGEEGTGLGLLLCKEFVEKNGGKIWVEPATKVGSIFTFTLPLVQT